MIAGLHAIYSTWIMLRAADVNSKIPLSGASLQSSHNALERAVAEDTVVTSVFSRSDSSLACGRSHGSDVAILMKVSPNCSLRLGLVARLRRPRLFGSMTQDFESDRSLH